MKAPGWLPKEAKKEWARVWPLLDERGTLTDADLSTLENYCLAVGQVQQCQAELSAGLTCTTSQGDIKPHPALRIQHAAIAHARSLARQLGMTPTSRDSAKRAKQEGTDGWAGLVDG